MTPTAPTASVSAAEAIGLIKPNSNVFIQGASATPHVLIDALVAQGERLQHTELYHLHTDGPAPYVQPEHREHFHANALFTGGNLRQAVAEGWAAPYSGRGPRHDWCAE